MGVRQVVDDPNDPVLGVFRDLTDAVLRRGIETADGLFIAESLQVVRRVLEDHADQVRVVVVTPHGAQRLADVVDRSPLVLVATPAVLAAVAGFEVHRGVLAAVARPPERDPAELVAGSRRLVVLEDLTDQVNLGALFRSASALGMPSPAMITPATGSVPRRSRRTPAPRVS